MRIDIATCSQKPGLTNGDRLFQSELKKLGVESSIIVWSETLSENLSRDAIIIRSVWDYHLDHLNFKNWVEKNSRGSKMLNAKELIFWNLDKSYLLELSRRGSKCVPSVIFDSGWKSREIVEKIKELGWPEIVVKPTISATAFLTSRSSVADSSLVEKLTRIQKHSSVLIQPYLHSVETDGELSFIFFNGRKTEFSHAILKMPASGDFRVQSDFGGSEVLYSPDPKLRQMAENVLQSIPGAWLFARVDIMNWKLDPVVSELELIEPDLFLSLSPGAARKLAVATLEKMAEKIPR